MTPVREPWADFQTRIKGTTCWPEHATSVCVSLKNLVFLRLVLTGPLFLLSVTVKDVKALLPQINYRVPNMRFLKDKLQVRAGARSSLRMSSCVFGLGSLLCTQEVEARSDLTYPNFAQLYRTLMFHTQKTVSASDF